MLYSRVISPIENMWQIMKGKASHTVEHCWHQLDNCNTSQTETTLSVWVLSQFDRCCRHHFKNERMCSVEANKVYQVDQEMPLMFGHQFHCVVIDIWCILSQPFGIEVLLIASCLTINVTNEMWLWIRNCSHGHKRLWKVILDFCSILS